MLKTSSRIALGFLVLYAAGILAFAFLHYGGDRPGAGAVLADFHAWLGLGTPEVHPPPPPAPPSHEPAPAVPPPVPSEPVPPTIEPAPDATPAGPAPTSEELDAVEKALDESEVAAREIRAMERGPQFDEKLREVLSKLGGAREVLNRLLDVDAKHKRGNRLWDRLQQIDRAIRHL